MNKTLTGLFQNEKSLFFLIILLAIVLVFLPCLNAEFTNWDDQSHLLDNPSVNAFTLDKIPFLFQETVHDTYIPLTMLSFALEYKMFGSNAFVFHLNNIILHVLISLLIYWFGLRLGFSARASGWAALLFGVHPMHVESVAWITERKDLLYSFFYLLAMHQYLSFLERRKIFFWVTAMALGILSLLSKPMAISLPLILLLLEWHKKENLGVKTWVRTAPFFIYTALLGWLTYRLHMRNPIDDLVEAFLIWAWTFGFYLWKFLWPSDFYPLYQLPQPVALASAPYFLSVVLFIAVVASVINFRKNRLWMFAVGYYFFSIFFLLRMDQGVDTNIVADRFMYLPSLGFCILFGVFLEKMFVFLERPAVSRYKIIGVALIWVLFAGLGLKTINQCRIWHDAITLWSHVIERYPKEYIAYNNRAVGYVNKGYHDFAIQDYSTILTFDPDSAETFFNRGQAYQRAGQNALSVQDLTKVVEVHPDFDKAYYHRGLAYESLGEREKAFQDFSRAVELNPAYSEAYSSLGNIYNNQNDFSLALENYNKAILLDPALSRAYNNRGTVYGKQGRKEQAIADFNKAIALDAAYAEAYYNRSVMFGLLGRKRDALGDALKALELGAPVPQSYISTLQDSINNMP